MQPRSSASKRIGPARFWSGYAQIYALEGGVLAQAVPSNWLQTGVRQTQTNYGLMGQYYTYTDNGNSPTVPTNGSTTGLFLTRTDPLLLNFQWNGSSPIPNGPSSDFLVKWTGYITVPSGGNYTFGTTSDDGSQASINVSGTNTSVVSAWHDQAPTTTWGSSVTLSAGQSYPIEVDYYQHQGGDMMSLQVQGPGITGNEVVPSNWLSPKVQVLPAGWSMGAGAGGTTYTGIEVNQSNAILTDSTGDTYDYTWNGSGLLAFFRHRAKTYGSLWAR